MRREYGIQNVLQYAHKTVCEVIDASQLPVNSRIL